MKAKYFLLPLVFFLAIISQAYAFDFVQKKNSASKASLTSNAYYVDYVLGVANFSPELRLPIQIFYDSSSKDEGMLGFAWSIPQLESSAIPNKDGAIWTTPWGEKISFYERNNVSREVLEQFKETERENSHFSPFADWTASGREDSGSWTFYGRKEKKGWIFTYLDAKLRKIKAPSGQEIEFIYKDGNLASIEQRGRAFVKLFYDKEDLLSKISINEIDYNLIYKDSKVAILPETLKANIKNIDTKQLVSANKGTLNPIKFSYDKAGYLSQIKRDKFIENIKVDNETLAQRRAYLSEIARKNYSATRHHIAGRILSDRNFKYTYPTNKIGNVKLINKLDQYALYDFKSSTGVFSHRDFSGKEFTTYYFMRYDVAYNGKVRQIVDGRKRILASYRYDKDTGNIIRYRDLAKNDVNFSYDENANLVLITKRGADEDSPLPIRSFEYFGDNPKPRKINDLNEKGEVVKTTLISYDKGNRPVSISDGSRTLHTTYNFYGYPTKSKNTFNQEVELVYDEYNRQKSIEQNGVKTFKQYDDNGLVLKTYSQHKDKILSSIDYAYDKNGAILSSTDKSGKTRKFERDDLGRLSKEIFADNTEVAYQYDELNRLQRVLDQNKNEIEFAWNTHGLDYKKTAVGQTTQNKYDEFGRLSSVESILDDWRTDRVFKYKYDDLDRRVQIFYSDTEIEKIKYDTWGRIIENSKNDLVSKYKYDHFGRLISKKEGTSLTTYTYDNYGNRLSRIIKDGEKVLDEYNTYDKYGRLVKTKSNGKTVEYFYNAKNQLVGQLLEKQKVVFEYTELGQLFSKAMLDDKGGVLSEIKYFYSEDGNINARLANGKLQSYKYDLKNQLLAVVDVESGEKVEQYTYDNTGNILRKIVNGKTTSYTYDATNQLVSSIDETGKETKYEYDAAGRLIKEGDKTYTYAWLDKVIQVSKGDEVLSTFTYHNNGQIATASRHNTNTNSPITETFQWDGLALIERNNTQYINEPHIGGGNPVLAFN